MSETFVMPEHGIVCFHCGETFTTYGGARDHFGVTPDCEPGCVIDRVALEKGDKPERGRGLLMALRKVESERDELRSRVESLERMEEMLDGLHADLRRYFGTVSPWLIHDRLSNAMFRAEHAVARLDEAGLPFERPAPSVEGEREERWEMKCQKCGAEVHLPATANGHDIAGITGWSFDTDNGWRCHGCTPTPAGSEPEEE